MDFNEKAVQIINEKVLPYQASLGVKHQVMNGVNVIDMGVNVKGSWKAGLLFTEISLCGYGSVQLRMRPVAGLLMPHVEVFVDYPHLVELANHVAFWFVSTENDELNFSGPVRSAVLDDYSKAVGYKENPKQVVICLQLDHFPSESMFEAIIEKAERPAEDIYLLIAPTGSMVGSLQVPARNVEQVIPTLLDKGFNVDSIIHACGVSPILAVVDDEMEAYGRVNDSLIYGQVTNLYVDCNDKEIEDIIPNLTMNQPKNKEIFGLPFKEIFEKCNNDWLQVPRHWDAPNEIVFHNLRTGKKYHVGEQHQSVLLEAIMGSRGKVYE